MTAMCASVFWSAMVAVVVCLCVIVCTCVSVTCVWKTKIHDLCYHQTGGHIVDYVCSNVVLFWEAAQVSGHTAGAVARPAGAAAPPPLHTPPHGPVTQLAITLGPVFVFRAAAGVAPPASRRRR